jgi:hypothetical protein
MQARSSRHSWRIPIILLFSAILASLGPAAFAHPTPLAKATLTLDEAGSYRMELVCDVPALVMQAKPGHTDEQLVGQFRAMSIDELAGPVSDLRRVIQQRLLFYFDGEATVPLVVEMPTPAQIKDTLVKGDNAAPLSIHAAGVVPRGAKQLAILFPSDVGPVSLTVVQDETTAGTQLIGEGETSTAISLTAANQMVSGASVAWDYAVLGFEHILPYGQDHILFVLGLFLLSPQLKPLLWQVTAFTVAHSITLILSSYTVVSLSPSIVEPLIALSIVFVAIENVLTPKLHAWRPIIVFLFGLLHGLGFAGVLAETGLPQNDFLTALVAFNVGVEGGQLAVIALAFLAVGWFRDCSWYRPCIAIPLSLAIAARGLYWTIERIWF